MNNIDVRLRAVVFNARNDIVRHSRFLRGMPPQIIRLNVDSRENDFTREHKNLNLPRAQFSNTNR